MSVLQIFIYAAALIFIVTNITRFIRMAATPIHLRWELYPVAHDVKRFKYGGSFLEESDWYTKHTQKSMMGELRVMLPEIFFLKGVWEYNRGLWFWSFMFHVGLYLLSALIGLLILGGIIIGGQIYYGPETLSLIGKIIYNLSYAMLWVGCIAGIIGSLGLIIKRASNREMSASSSFGSYFNLIFIGAIFVTGLIFLLSGNAVDTLLKFYYTLITFKTMPQFGTAFTVYAAVSGAFILYLPFTHMTHFFMKYFTYHKVRWEDEPNFRGSKMEKKIQKQLSYPVTWAAKHINADGKKNWVDIATEEVKKDEK
jgi:nitrate reductase gamma subunit